MTDKYDVEIGCILREIDNACKDQRDVFDSISSVIMDHWDLDEEKDNQFLFQFTDRKGNFVAGTNLDQYGCLTQVRGMDHFVSPFFNEEIKNDNRLHDGLRHLICDVIWTKSNEEIVELLYPYAEWQRKLDEAHQRKKGPTCDSQLPNSLKNCSGKITKQSMA